MDVATKKYVDGAIPVASNITPSPNNATPAVGTATTWARADHVHKMPSASDVNAATVGDIPAASSAAPA